MTQLCEITRKPSVVVAATTLAQRTCHCYHFIYILNSSLLLLAQ